MSADHGNATCDRHHSLALTIHPVMAEHQCSDQARNADQPQQQNARVSVTKVAEAPSCDPNRCDCRQQANMNPKIDWGSGAAQFGGAKDRDRCDQEWECQAMDDTQGRGSHP